MRKLNLVSSLLVSVVLVGCATAPKPEMTEAEYTKYAKGWWGLDYCGWKGWIAPDTVAYGKQLIRSQVQTYSIVEDRFNQEVTRVNSTEVKPPKEECNQLAVMIAERKQQIDINNQAVRYNQQETQDLVNKTKLQNTYCNRIGAQTFCNTF